MLIAIIISCDSDVSIIKRYDNLDTSISLLNDTSSIPPIPIESEPEATTGYLRYYLKQVACPACVGESQELFLELKLEMHEPITDVYADWIPAIGTCTESFIYTDPSTIPLSIGQKIDVQSIHTISLYQSQTGTYLANPYESQYDRDSTHNVYNGTTLLFDFRTIEGFDFIEPYTMLWVDPSYAFDAPISRNGATFWWGPANDQSQIFNITIAIYSWDGSSLLGYVSCSGSNSGQLTVPAEYLSKYPTGSLTAIHLTRHKLSLELSTELNSYIQTHMEWEVIGTGYLQ